LARSRAQIVEIISALMNTITYGPLAKESKLLINKTLSKSRSLRNKRELMIHELMNANIDLMN
jgi:hypothetical protein